MHRKGIPCEHVISEVIRLQQHGKIADLCSAYWHVAREKGTSKRVTFTGTSMPFADGRGEEAHNVLSELLDENESELFPLFRRFMSLKDAGQFKEQELFICQSLKHSIHSLAEKSRSLTTTQATFPQIRSPVHPSGRKGRGSRRREKGRFDQDKIKSQRRPRQFSGAKRPLLQHDKTDEVDVEIINVSEEDTAFEKTPTKTPETRAGRKIRRRKNIFGDDAEWEF
eukprot:TRINITY_DN17958_c0_g2_i1.p1 TRINITY_DN17958_c0_g2~~TRINITY_DN17958_c0_g2_i1.p1  ORF type:complete len:245 (-),score=46.37 TRINITY_DN17958_c0_g2_i1:176-850(-)